MKEIHPLWATVIILLTSLFIAYITFGILESSGVVKDERIQLGGSVAGFIGIFYVASKFYSLRIDKLSSEKITKLEQELDNVKKSPSDILFTLVFDRDVKFNNLEKNGRYWISEGKNEIDKGNLLLEFKEANKVLEWPGGWVWRSPIKVGLNATIRLLLEEDDKKKWTVKKTPDLLMIPLYPKEGDNQ